MRMLTARMPLTIQWVFLFAVVPSSLVAQEGVTSQTVFHCDFESPNWWQEWGLRESPPRVNAVDEDSPRKFQPRAGKALRVRIDQGGHYGVSLQYRFAKRLGHEPEEIYFRYYLRLADDWNPHRGGKLPGIGGTYGRAGWGGRKVDGTDGWSARGLFRGRANGHTPIGYYCYHADMQGKYGDNWIWDNNGFPGLENNRWYCIEQHVKMNTAGKNDGVLRGWVDDVLVFERTDVRMRDVDTLKIETVWINVYLGGTWSAKKSQHLFIDDIAIGPARIGR